MPSDRSLHGSDQLRKWLERRGFNTSIDGLRQPDNLCNWYAYKRAEVPSRECECNEGKPIQIVVRPHAYRCHDRLSETCQIEVIGEAGGLWFQQKAYGLKEKEVRKRYDEIERMLVSAWNALLPVSEKQPT